MQEVLAAYFDVSPVGMFIVDTHFHYLLVNEAFAAINGPTVREHVGRKVRDVLPHLADTIEPIMSTVMERREAILNLEIRGERPRHPGHRGHWLASYFPLLGSDQQIVGVGGAVVEFTDRKRAEEALSQSEQRFRTLVINTSAVAYFTDAKGEPLGEASSWHEFTGQTIEETRNGRWIAAIHPDDRERVTVVVSRALAAGTEYRVENRLRRWDGEWRHVSIRGIPIRDATNAVCEWAAWGEDVTEQKQKEATLLRDAVLDPLTGLYNRRFGEAGLSKALAHAETSGQPLLAVMFDLDNFKVINDRFGHGAGDCVLVEFARRLSNAVRHSDFAMRLGGDEFLLVLCECPPDNLELVLRRIVTLDVVCPTGNITVASSVGWTQYKKGDTIDELLRRADSDLYAQRTRRRR